tara:strand:+ start:90 stop:782 length:693 start_codon:yes stop_codon:yes gene_type:complete
MEKKEKGMTTFEKLSAINVNNKTEKKNNLTYLSWAWAWSEVKKACPDATYEMGETTYDEVLGFMCYSSVTIDGETLPMWLPVMDGANKAMKKVAYNYSTRYGDKEVAQASSFDINKTMMRCLVKNLAMFGMGIYIYAGEDLPESETEQTVSKVNDKAKAVAVAKTEKKEPKHITLDIGDGNWVTVLRYIARNKSKGLDAIVNTLSTKYTISTTVKKSIKEAVDVKDTPSE